MPVCEGVHYVAKRWEGYSRASSACQVLSGSSEPSFLGSAALQAIANVKTVARRCKVFMNAALDVYRLQFAFTVTFHYIFPQLTMGLALLLLILKTLAIVTGNEHYNRAMRFWARIFAINFALGVVTGIPWNFSSARIGPSSHGLPGASSVRPWRWKGSSRFSLSPASWACCFTVRAAGRLVIGWRRAWRGSAGGYRAT